MPGEDIQTAQDLLARIRPPAAVALDCSVMQKGIDNYAIDVELDTKFLIQAKVAVQEVVKRVVAARRGAGDTEHMDALRAVYADMIRVSLHRTKTDLKAPQVRIVQFAIMKYIITQVKTELDGMVHQVEETLAQQQFSGSRSLMVTQERLAWLRKHYGVYRYRTVYAILRQLQREETNQLRPLREQFLGDQLGALPHILFNPMLAAPAPLTPQLLVDSYALWPAGAREFNEANAALESFLGERLPGLGILTLKSSERPEAGGTEIYDALGGLFAAQPVLGASPDQKDAVMEEFCWLAQPGNIRLLFDPAVHDRLSQAIGDRRVQRAFKSEAKKLEKIGLEARAKFASDAQVKEMIAGYVLRDDWPQSNDEIIDIASACAYVAGNDAKRILGKIDQSQEGAAALVKQMDDWSKEVNRRFKAEQTEVSLRILTDLSRFRLHLKYYRLAHRIFNRLNVITEPQKIQLSKANGHLYSLLGEEQNNTGEVEREVVHHTILKADVRGSTVVTQELIKQNLNPASYFSTRFFGPITNLLGEYGAVKVFIEGDAVILAIYEHNVDPQQWYSVSRACGMAKDMLDIVTSKNTNSRRTGIPPLEIGIGICYSDDKPLFLFDQDKPIMISPAIGEADRMSSCSWKLREVYGKGPFNVEVLEIAEGDRERGEKGQEYLRYNVNGILLTVEAFQKLKSEIRLKKLKVKVGEVVETMYVGRFPNALGKERDLVVREGAVGVWKDDVANRGGEGSEVFYEILPNSKVAGQVLELARNQAGKGA